VKGPTLTPLQVAAIIDRSLMLEAENARLRSLLDDYHRGAAVPPPAPPRYDAAGQRCQIPGCVRVQGHQGFHCTSDQIAKREDGRS
jgi:hypothetical protein